MSYTYNINTDFGHGINLRLLEQEIKYNFLTSFSTLLVGNNINIYFSESLNNNDTARLNNIIKNHDPTIIPKGTNVMNISVPINRLTNTIYTTIITFVYPGMKNMNVTNIKVISKLESHGNSYDVKIIDITNNKVIASNNFNNISELVNDMGNISNLDENESILELQAKINGSAIAYIKNLNIYFD